MTLNYSTPRHPPQLFRNFKVLKALKTYRRIKRLDAQWISAPFLFPQCLPPVQFASFLPSPLTGPCRHQKKAKRMYGTQGLSFFAFLLACCMCAWTLFFFFFVFPRGKLVENSRKPDRRQMFLMHLTTHCAGMR
jgi:hypothetical protein